MKTKRKKNTSTLILIFAAALVVGGLVVAGCATGIGDHLRTYSEMRNYAKMHGDERDFSTERVSDNRSFRVSFEPQEETIPLRQMHAWKIRVRSSDGSAVEEATIQVDGGMPEHGHGLPTQPQVTQALGDGAYLVEGMKFQMPGWWIVRFDVTTAQGSDSVTFNLML